MVCEELKDRCALHYGLHNNNDSSRHPEVSVVGNDVLQTVRLTAVRQKFTRIRKSSMEKEKEFVFMRNRKSLCLKEEDFSFTRRLVINRK